MRLNLSVLNRAVYEQNSSHFGEEKTIFEYKQNWTIFYVLIMVLDLFVRKNHVNTTQNCSRYLGNQIGMNLNNDKHLNKNSKKRG